MAAPWARRDDALHCAGDCRTAVLFTSAAASAADVQVKKWPDDVPCDAVKKNADGSYAQLQDLMMGTMPMPKKSYGKETAEAKAWDRKCAGKAG